ncbi:MAG: hypothetical protein AAF555_07230 [Verrucomicrobiota bacterium]
MENKDRLREHYLHKLREEGQAPASVYRFCQELGLSERDFFSHFASFEAIEQGFWRETVTGVLDAVRAGEEWDSFDARQKLLTFLYAFTEKSLDFRSLLLLRFQEVSVFKKLGVSRGMEEAFKDFAREILEQGRESGEVARRGRLNALQPEALYVLFRAVMDYHLKDTSEGYERTDAFIEKAVTLGFDLLRTQVIDSTFDLARFLFARRSVTA